MAWWGATTEDLLEASESKVLDVLVDHGCEQDDIPIEYCEILLYFEVVSIKQKIEEMEHNEDYCGKWYHTYPVISSIIHKAWSLI